MSDISNITLSYINENYEVVNNLNDHVSVVQNKLDKKNYILKNSISVYDIEIYKRLQDADIEGIPRIYELVKTEEGISIVEEYISGKTLDDSVRIFVDEKSVIEFIYKLCSILERIHSLNPPIIHRDIKPQNIILSNGNVYLMDFNISRNYKGTNSKDTIMMGTQEYAAPEQYGFAESDVRTDIYGLGSTVKYILDNSLIKSKKLNMFVKKCMQLDPDNRFQDIKEVRLFLKKRMYGYIFETKSKYALPGFRTGNVFKALVATVYYAYTIVYCFLTPLDDSTNIVYTIAFSIYQYIVLMIAPLIIFDYLNIHKKFHINKFKWYVRYPLALLISAAIGVFLSFLFIFFEILFG